MQETRAPGVSTPWPALTGLAFATYVATAFVLLRLDLPILHGLLPAAVALAIAAACRPAFAAAPVGAPLDLPTVALVAVAGLGVTAMFWHGWALPAHDPIAVPVLAQAVVGGDLPLEIYSPGSSAFSYPPGAPIMLGTLGFPLSQLDRLLLMKVATLAAVTLVPYGWAWLVTTLFPLPVRPWVAVAASYLVFFGLERTLGFTVPFAGKNALLVGLAALPFVTAAFVSLARSRWAFAAGGFALFGLTLVNYSLLHLMAALLGAYTLVELLARRLTLADAARIAGAGLIAAALMLAFLSEALFDPRTGNFTPALLSGLGSVIDTLTARRSPIVIYMDGRFGIAGFPYRGLFLAACFGVTLAAAGRLRLPALRAAAWTFALAVVTMLMFGFAVLPAGISFDFARWVLWPLQAALMLTAALGLWLVAVRDRTAVRLAAAAALAGLVVAGPVLAVNDARVFRAVTNAQALGRSDLQRLVHTFRGRPCHLVADSIASLGGLVTVQKSRLLDHAEAVTPCRYLNGSWVQPGVPGGRDLDGLPAAEVLREALETGTTYLVAPTERLRTYIDALRADGLRVESHEAGRLSDIPVWRLIPDPLS